MANPEPRFVKLLIGTVAVLYKGDEAPVSTTDANVETIIRV